jgi:hypothetical protein
MVFELPNARESVIDGRVVVVVVGDAREWEMEEESWLGLSALRSPRTLSGRRSLI